jgi:hypothetical protein
VALPVFLILLVAYGYVGYLLFQQYQAGMELSAGLNRTGTLWQALRKQPPEDLDALRKEIARAQDKVTTQQALFAKETESVAVVDMFVALARENRFLILQLTAQPTTQQKTKGGTYQVARYAVQAQGNSAEFPEFLRKLAERTGTVALGLDNLTVVPAGGADDIRFDLLIYVRVG